MIFFWGGVIFLWGDFLGGVIFLFCMGGGVFLQYSTVQHTVQYSTYGQVVFASKSWRCEEEGGQGEEEQDGIHSQRPMPPTAFSVPRRNKNLSFFRLGRNKKL